jgi:ERF superfamily
MKDIYSAFVAAQKEFGPALKTSSNPHFKSRYADLSACVEAVIDALNNNGIALVQKNLPCDSGVCVETVFLHTSGETFSSGPLHVPAAKQDPQGYGSALTYARRYSLMAACGIAPEDDDGNAGSKPVTPTKKEADKNDPAEIIRAVKAGKAADVATYLATLSQVQIDKVWGKLPADIQDEITDKWPG